MKKIHENFYFTDDESLHFVWQESDKLLHIHDDEDHWIVFNENDIKDLLWFIKNKVRKK